MPSRPRSRRGASAGAGTTYGSGFNGQRQGPSRRDERPQRGECPRKQRGSGDNEHHRADRPDNQRLRGSPPVSGSSTRRVVRVRVPPRTRGGSYPWGYEPFPHPSALHRHCGRSSPALRLAASRLGPGLWTSSVIGSLRSGMIEIPWRSLVACGTTIAVRRTGLTPGTASLGLPEQRRAEPRSSARSPSTASEATPSGYAAGWRSPFGVPGVGSSRTPAARRLTEHRRNRGKVRVEPDSKTDSMRLERTASQHAETVRLVWRPGTLRRRVVLVRVAPRVSSTRRRGCPHRAVAGWTRAQSPRQ